LSGSPAGLLGHRNREYFNFRGIAFTSYRVTYGIQGRPVQVEDGWTSHANYWENIPGFLRGTRIIARKERQRTPIMVCITLMDDRP
jgi:hypothetical protein